MKSRILRHAGALAALLAVSGCSSLSYYAQSLDGHLELMAARQNVERLIEKPSTPEPLRNRMAAAHEIRQFAITELDLPDNDSYRSYVDIKRDYVTWAVFAAPEFSLAPHVKCFPVFGCVPYQGFFDPEDALREAHRMKDAGFDVHISGINAYSTLGLTSDPLLSTMFRADRTYLAGIVFHELAHQRVYVKGDTPFNEAFAVAVETTGVRKYLSAHGDTKGIRAYEADRKRQAEFVGLIGKTRAELHKIYQGPGSDAEKRKAKDAAIKRLRARYEKMRDTKWGGDRAYDGWFATPINNAKLAATSVYNDNVDHFIRLFELCGEDYPRFYDAVARYGQLERDKRMDALKGAKSCGKVKGGFGWGWPFSGRRRDKKIGLGKANIPRLRKFVKKT